MTFIHQPFLGPVSGEILKSMLESMSQLSDSFPMPAAFCLSSVNCTHGGI